MMIEVREEKETLRTQEGREGREGREEPKIRRTENGGAVYDPRNKPLGLAPYTLRISHLRSGGMRSVPRGPRRISFDHIRSHEIIEAIPSRSR